MNATDWLQLIGLGGVVGAIGQGVRMIVGFKKLNDAAGGRNAALSGMIALHRLIVPLAIGFIAGAIAAISAVSNLADISGQQIMALAAAGYAGADFIEGFMTRIAPATNVPLGQDAVGVAAPAPPAPAPAPAG